MDEWWDWGCCESGILTPASHLRIKDEDEENYRDGFVFEKTQEILTRGHVLSSVTRVDNVKLRAQAAKYVISPSKFKFVKTIRITAIVRVEWFKSCWF